MTTFKDDRTSGSGDVALAFLTELERWTAVDTSPSSHALRESLLVFLRAAQAAQPTMALVHQLATRALDVADAGAKREDPPPLIREQLIDSCAAERGDLVKVRAAVVHTALELVTDREPWIATLSLSGAVRDALLKAQERGLAPRALIGEGRPHLEGRAHARALAAAGIPVWLVADATLPLLLAHTQMLWLGADAVTDQGVINKVGSYAAALAARERSVPVYALAERRKFLPASTGALRIVEQHPGELWSDPPEGVRPRNIYFELVPMELLRGIAVEDAVVGASEAATIARERPLPGELAAG